MRAGTQVGQSRCVPAQSLRRRSLPSLRRAGTFAIPQVAGDLVRLRARPLLSVRSTGSFVRADLRLLHLGILRTAGMERAARWRIGGGGGSPNRNNPSLGLRRGLATAGRSRKWRASSAMCGGSTTGSERRGIGMARRAVQHVGLGELDDAAETSPPLCHWVLDDLEVMRDEQIGQVWRAWISRSRFTICAWIGIISALTGSSATISLGPRPGRRRCRCAGAGHRKTRGG